MKKFRDWKWYTREHVFLCRLTNETVKIRTPHKKFGRVLQHFANIGLLEILDGQKETTYFVPQTFYVMTGSVYSKTISQGKTITHRELIEELLK